MKRQTALLALWMASAAIPAYATPSCEPTPKVPTSNYPGAASIPPNNNLILPAGKSIPAEGQELIIQGQLLDKECKPIPDAVVELWQRDPFGRFILAEGEDLVTPNPAFAGAGRTITDSEGRFVFTTAFPGVSTKPATKKTPAVTGAPVLNFRVKARDFAEFKTAVFFAGDKRNAADPGLKKISLETRGRVALTMSESEEGQLVGALEFVLPGKTPYRIY